MDGPWLFKRSTIFYLFPCCYRYLSIANVRIEGSCLTLREKKDVEGRRLFIILLHYDPKRSDTTLNVFTPAREDDYSSVEQ